uniref:Ig-like domain-containing protein n=1 Tax=Pyxicephalus adspersus TaxID=30357 RepID=A0AAV3A0D7_PYXAD|nr:TPA: hypothetical protein GDO54_013618 [Pyxicephalus adspersus]
MDGWIMDQDGRDTIDDRAGSCQGGIQGLSVNQTLAQQLIPEKEPVLLKCTYKTSGTPYPFWYVQYPGHAPTMLLNDLTQKSHKGFSGTHEQKNSSYNMVKGQVEITDSGVYFCAVSDTVNESHSSPVT